jgi:Spy/CpxP family protein refolding chaperone
MIAKKLITLSMVMAFGWVIVEAEPAPGAIPPSGPSVSTQAVPNAPLDPSKKFRVPEAAKPGHVAPERIGIPVRPPAPPAPVPPAIRPLPPLPPAPFPPGIRPAPAPWVPPHAPFVRPAPAPWIPAPLPPYWRGWHAPLPWGPPPPPYWGPPIPDHRYHYWFWFIWSPLPWATYEAAPVQNNYYYMESDKQAGPEQSKETFDAAKYQKQYEKWLVKELGLTGKQKGKFLSQLKALQTVREEYLEERNGLSRELSELQSQKAPEIRLQQKMNEMERLDVKFRADEQKAIDKMLSTLTVEQRAKYYSLQSPQSQTQ